MGVVVAPCGGWAQVQLEAKENALGQTKRDLQHESASRERLRTELLTRETDVATLKVWHP